MMEYVASFLRFLTRMVIYMSCAAVTVFIMANSYETAFGISLPYIKAVEPVTMNVFQTDPHSLAGDLSKQTDSQREGNYGTPEILKVANNAIRIPIAAPLFRDKTWLARSSTAHYVIISNNKDGDIGDMILYTNANKTTIEHPELVEAGKNAYIDTKRNWRYFYRIDEVLTLTSNSPRYVIPTSKKSRLYIVVQKSDTRILIVGTLTNVQNADQ